MTDNARKDFDRFVDSLKEHGALPENVSPYGYWLSAKEQDSQCISDLDRRNAELFKFQDRTLRGQCVCSSEGTDREHYPGCRVRDVARIAELERRNGELETLASHLRHCRGCGEMDVMHCDDGRPLWEAAMLTEHPQGESNEQQ